MADLIINGNTYKNVAKVKFKTTDGEATFCAFNGAKLKSQIFRGYKSTSTMVINDTQTELMTSVSKGE